MTAIKLQNRTLGPLMHAEIGSSTLTYSQQLQQESHNNTENAIMVLGFETSVQQKWECTDEEGVR